MPSHSIGEDTVKRAKILLLFVSLLGCLIFLLQPVALATGITVFVTVISSEDGPHETDAAVDDAVVSWASGVYSNNMDTMQKLEIPRASALEVTAIGRTEVGYDRVHIYNSEGEEIRRLSGVIHTTFTVPGSSIRVRFVTDGSVTDQGVVVSVRAVAMEGDESPGASASAGFSPGK